MSGLGVDVVDVAGFAAQLADPASVFAARTFTEGELRDADARPDRVRALAGRFAAKEAFVKAWDGMAFGQPPAMRQADLQQIEVVCDAWGRPAICLHGAVAEVCGDVTARVSISHDGGVAVAVVILGS